MSNNINFNFNKKKKFTIDGDENRVIELDTFDVGVVKRFNDNFEKIEELQEKQAKLTELAKNEKDNAALDFSKLFAEIEKDIRMIIDHIFDSPVSDVILGNSSAFSPSNGKFKFEEIIDVLSSLYEKDIQAETQKINMSHIRKHTDKYKK